LENSRHRFNIYYAALALSRREGIPLHVTRKTLRRITASLMTSLTFVWRLYSIISFQILEFNAYKSFLICTKTVLCHRHKMIKEV